MNLRTKLLCGLAAVITTALVAQAQTPGVNSNITAVFNMVYEASTTKPTYSASRVFNPTATSATDVCYVTGSASRTIRVRRILLSGLASAVVSDPVSIIKRSSAPASAGLTQLVVPYDSSFGAGTAVAEVFTANPTVGTYVGTIADPYMTWGNLTTGVGAPLELRFGQFGGPVVLRGAAQTLAVNLNGVSLTTPQLSCTFEWTEE